MKKVTDSWCDECGRHADILINGTPLCASCYLKKEKKRGVETNEHEN